jgi:fluoride exporter
VIVVAVALAGALGAPARYVVESLVRRVRPGPFPLGTFLVNGSGSFLLGIVIGLAARGTLDADARTVVGIGFLGAYTTFSTYAYEAVRLAESRERPRAALYAVASVLLAGGAAALGLALTGAL